MSSCQKVGNNKIAKIIINENKTYIQLTGKRKALTHDFISIFQNNLINDTLLLPMHSEKDSIIYGKDINVEEGYYKYTGYVIIKPYSLFVNLFLINTDLNKQVPELYNGKYILKRSD